MYIDNTTISYDVALLKCEVISVNVNFEICARSTFIKDQYGFINVPITNEMVEISKIKAERLGTLRNSIRNGEGNVVGYLGVEVIKAACYNIEDDDTYNNDLKCNETKLEVKTKERTVFPLPHYDASIAAYNSTQKTDYYLFVSILKMNNIYNTAHIIGYITPSEYFKNARFFKKGDIDGSNNFPFKADCYNVEYSKLKSIRKLFVV